MWTITYRTGRIIIIKIQHLLNAYSLPGNVLGALKLSSTLILVKALQYV